ncbi:OmpA family protein [Pseudomonas lalucatii]|uniref:OmpA family protein n=1 Tax=Pseudomonas lalucatii TaxID=1424203 RepID=A0ABS5PW95_9PSED|nr:OmpA family protein [Pseudomonas lalucatii]MBS7660363.1 OmpA family protein [Pseudomonas lalucatii]MBS7724692.1 OmpA family protein [Pseudomonas lalucatii]QVM88972.1 OmpA family protein [Pseudomonas lalucatii]
MKLKNTLGVVIGSLVAASCMSALAQGQGAVEVEAFGKRYMTDSSRDLSNGNLLGGSVGYYLTDDVELALSYGEYHDIRSENGTGNKNIKGNLAGLDAIYHFGEQGVGLRPYVSAGFAHQNISNVPARTGRDHSTFANVGTGVKYFFSENLFARAGVDGMYNIDANEAEWAAGLGVGMNFGGSSKPAPAPAPVAAVQPVAEPVQVEEEPMEMVRVELDVKFDFDKANVKQESYGDIKNLADFMNQYPQTTTTVEGHTDAKGSDAYNQKLSERRANAVREVLVNQYGVQGERVNAVGYGESRPVADNASDAGRAINRRVEAEVEAQIKQ